MVNDVEKRWSDPEGFRKAAVHVGVAVGLALGSMVAILVWTSTGTRGYCQDGAFRVCTSPGRYLVAFVPTGVLFLGGISALVRAYSTWRRGGKWPIWQGAGWFLLILMLIYMFTFGGAAVTA